MHIIERDFDGGVHYTIAINIYGVYLAIFRNSVRIANSILKFPAITSCKVRERPQIDTFFLHYCNDQMNGFSTFIINRSLSVTVSSLCNAIGLMSKENTINAGEIDCKENYTFDQLCQIGVGVKFYRQKVLDTVVTISKSTHVLTINDQMVLLDRENFFMLTTDAITFVVREEEKFVSFKFTDVNSLIEFINAGNFATGGEVPTNLTHSANGSITNGPYDYDEKIVISIINKTEYSQTEIPKMLSTTHISNFIANSPHIHHDYRAIFQLVQSELSWYDNQTFDAIYVNEYVYITYEGVTYKSTFRSNDVSTAFYNILVNEHCEIVSEINYQTKFHNSVLIRCPTSQEENTKIHFDQYKVNGNTIEFIRLSENPAHDIKRVVTFDREYSLVCYSNKLILINNNRILVFKPIYFGHTLLKTGNLLDCNPYAVFKNSFIECFCSWARITDRETGKVTIITGEIYIGEQQLPLYLTKQDSGLCNISQNTLGWYSVGKTTLGSIPIAEGSRFYYTKL